MVPALTICTFDSLMACYPRDLRKFPTASFFTVPVPLHAPSTRRLDLTTQEWRVHRGAPCIRPGRIRHPTRN